MFLIVLALINDNNPVAVDNSQTYSLVSIVHKYFTA